MQELLNKVVSQMIPILNNGQIIKLKNVLENELGNYDFKVRSKRFTDSNSNKTILSEFLSAKSLEGCSPKTIKYYKMVLNNLFKEIKMSYLSIKTENLRNYLSDYCKRRNCSKQNIDNIRRIMSSFFSWLEQEDYILKSPMKRIHKIKVEKTIKEGYSDENLEILRDNASCTRDLAIIELLISSGIRIGELVKLDRNDIDFENMECIVLGKGNKERTVYFDSKTKLHISQYIKSRMDSNPALFVSLNKPYNRLEISGIEIRLRKLGKKLGIEKVHPHRFRRTMATRAINKGMPIEQVQQLLGHSQIDTTMRYAIVNQNNVKISHRKYIS